MKHDPGQATVAGKSPLVVDLDGTLIRADLFVEGMLRFLKAAPANIFPLLSWLLAGRAVAKQRVAQAAPCSPADLPYDERVVAWLREEKTAGREIVLATASDEREARAVADHLGIFDRVVASDGVENLKSRRKASRLRELFPDGFAYVGNEYADLEVWKAADATIVANAPAALVRKVARRDTPEKVFPRTSGTLRALVKAMRPQQWSKNFLVFVPLIAGQGWFDPAAWRDAVIALFALSLAASSVYLVNDAVDIDADRKHHRKRSRPFASGTLSPLTGILAAAALLASGLALGAVGGVAWLVLAYVCTSTLYSFWLKRKMLVDVFVLASLYMMRVLIGGVAASSAVRSYHASSWLLAFSCFFFLSLALVKRFTEISAVASKGGGDLAGRGYRGSDAMMIAIMGVASGFVSSLVLALYLQSETVAMNYRNPFLLWTLPAAMVYWQCRVWLMAHRGEVHDDPLVFALRDRISWAVGAVIAAAFATALVIPPTAIP